MSESQEKASNSGWRCFHCGVFCATEDEAIEHFGPTQDWTPSCQERATDLQLLERTRQAERAALSYRKQRDEAESEAEAAHGRLSMLGYYFKGASSVYDAHCQFHSMEGRALAAEAILAVAERLDPGLVAKARLEVVGPEPVLCVTEMTPEQRRLAFGAAAH